MNNLDKRNNLLKNLTENIKNLDSRIKNNLFKLFLRPDIYLPFIFFKLFPITYKRKINYFGKEIQILIDSFDNFIFSKFNFLFGWWEIHLTGYLIKNLTKKDIFYDIGANTGFYSYLSSFFVKEVHIFEPIHYYIQDLRENLKSFKCKFYLNNLALSNECGEEKIFYNSGKTSFFNKTNLNFNVKKITLDSYLKNHNKPTLLKIDVEGAEYLVLKGAKNFLKTNNPKIFIEVWSKKVKNSQKSQLAIDYLRSFGFKAHLIDDEFNLKKAPKDILTYLADIKQSTENILFSK